MSKIVLASGNAGKLREFSALFDTHFAEQNIELIPQTQLNVIEAEETGLSFVENAILKARMPALPPVCRHWPMIPVLKLMPCRARPEFTAPAMPLRMMALARATVPIMPSCWRRLKTCLKRSVQPVSSAYWCICVMPPTQHHRYSRAAGKAVF